MSHRAEQIVDAAVTAIAAVVPSGVNVYAHRRLSLAEDQGELPAVSVDFGPDEPFEQDGASNIAFIDSLLTLRVLAVRQDVEEGLLKSGLLDMRRDVHIGLMADRTLGLAFVADTRYQGAEEPEINTDGDVFVGALATNWSVHYRMNIADPGD